MPGSRAIQAGKRGLELITGSVDVELEELSVAGGKRVDGLGEQSDVDLSELAGRR